MHPFWRVHGETVCKVHVVFNSVVSSCVHCWEYCRCECECQDVHEGARIHVDVGNLNANARAWSKQYTRLDIGILTTSKEYIWTSTLVNLKMIRVRYSVDHGDIIIYESESHDVFCFSCRRQKCKSPTTQQAFVGDSHSPRQDEMCTA